VTGLAFNLEEDNVGVALFGEWARSRKASPCGAPARSRRSRSAKASSAASSTRSATARRLGPIESSETRPVEWKAPGASSASP